MADGDLAAVATAPWPPPAPSGAADRRSSPVPAPDAAPTERLPRRPVLRRLLDVDRTAVIVLGPDGSIVEANDIMLELLGATSSVDLAPGTPANDVLRSLLDHLPQELTHGAGGRWQGDLDHVGLDGERRLLRATAHVTTGQDGGRDTTALLVHDVTDARQTVQDLRERIGRDALTGLPDRRGLVRSLATRLVRQPGEAGRIAVLSVDLDHFRYVNEAFGHAVGDELIRAAAARLTEAIRPSDHLARTGADEFVVVGDDIADAAMALDVAERIRRALSGHLRLGALDLDVSVSVGVAVSDPGVFGLGERVAAETLIGNAETAMRIAKSSARRRAVLFTAAMRAAAHERNDIAAMLARTVDGHALTVEYQPVYSAVSHEVVGAEALARWYHPERGPVDAATFIAIAEETGLIARVGRRVLGQALADLRRWIDGLHVSREFRLHVNVSNLELTSPAYVHETMTALREHGLDPDRLVLEIRNTSLTGRVPDIDRSIRALRRYGVSIAVDNFGSGPKALDVMTDVGADIVKLDGELALPADASAVQGRVVRALALLAHALDMSVIAQRVAERAQLERLTAAGCDMIQGNVLAEPCDAREFVASTTRPVSDVW